MTVEQAKSSKLTTGIVDCAAYTVNTTSNADSNHQAVFVGVSYLGDIYSHIRMSTDLRQCTHCDFIVLFHWEIKPSAPLSDFPLILIILALSQPALVLS